MNSAPGAVRHKASSHAPPSARSQDSASESTPRRVSGHAEPHTHRCAQCRERMAHACIDPSCAEGYQWVIVCFLCYERLESAARGDW